MIDRVSTEGVVRVRNLQDYFRSSIDDALARQRVDIDPHAAHYVVNLLTTFSRPDELYEDDGESYGIRPLALMLADAADAKTAEHRNAILRRIGDVALFISGFFANGLARKAVDVDYYIHMGGGAYGSLSEEVRGTTWGRTFSGLFRELAHKFQLLVDVLNEISEGSKESSDIDLLRTYEVWRKTGSQRAKTILKKYGVVPIAESGFRGH